MVRCLPIGVHTCTQYLRNRARSRAAQTFRIFASRILSVAYVQTFGDGPNRTGTNAVVIRGYLSGTFLRNSSSHTVASESLGARQSPRGLSEPPEPTFGPFGRQLRLNWLI